MLIVSPATDPVFNDYPFILNHFSERNPDKIAFESPRRNTFDK